MMIIKNQKRAAQKVYENENDQVNIMHWDGRSWVTCEKVKIEKLIAETCKCKIICRMWSRFQLYPSKRQSEQLPGAVFSEAGSGCPWSKVPWWIAAKLACQEDQKNGVNGCECMVFLYHGKKFWKETLLFLHWLSQIRFWSLVKDYKMNGLA